MTKLPSSKELKIPLLQAVADNDGKVSADSLRTAMESHFNISVPPGHRWHTTISNTLMSMDTRDHWLYRPYGLVGSGDDVRREAWLRRNKLTSGQQVWEITDEGREKLKTIVPSPLPSGRSTYLLTWNPTRYNWQSLLSDVAIVQSDGFLDGNWSCGNSKKPRPEDRFFLLRQGSTSPGIVGSGTIRSESFQELAFDSVKASQGGTARYVDVEFNALFDADAGDVLPRARLNQGILKKMNWSTRASGITIPPDVACKLEDVWQQFVEGKGCDYDGGFQVLPDEEGTGRSHREGKKRQVWVDIYERNPKARTECIEHYGCACCVCEFDFEKEFGNLGKGFIHVHHLKPISTIKKEYIVDPIKDLRPVCPNCHAMLHKSTDPYLVKTIAALKRERKKHSD